MKLANGLKLAAEIPVGLLVVFLLFMGIGETLGGDPSGIVAHVIPAAVFGLLMWLAWKRPLYAGIALVLLGILALVNFGIKDAAPLLIMVMPLLLAGLLLLLAAWKTPTPAK